MDAVGFGPRGHMLPDGSSGHFHSPKDEGVRDEDQEARDDVAEDKEGPDVELRFSGGHFPLDAASCPIGLWPIAAPVGQRGHCKDEGVNPDAR